MRLVNNILIAHSNSFDVLLRDQNRQAPAALLHAATLLPVALSSTSRLLFYASCQRKKSDARTTTRMKAKSENNLAPNTIGARITKKVDLKPISKCVISSRSFLQSDNHPYTPTMKRNLYRVMHAMKPEPMHGDLARFMQRPYLNIRK